MLAQLAPSELRYRVDPALFVDFSPQETLKEAHPIIGQERAIRALTLGLGVRSDGFNIYVSGVPGTGRTTAVMNFLEREAKQRPVPDDLCYVNNFKDPYRPNFLRLPPGRADELKTDMRNLTAGIRRELARIFESEEYAERREKITREIQNERNELIAKINAEASREGFSIQLTPMGYVFLPVKDGKPMAEEEFNAMTPEQRQDLENRQHALRNDLKSVMRQMTHLERKANHAMAMLDKDVATYALSPLMEDLREKYAGLEGVLAYFTEVEGDILNNLDQFRPEKPKRPVLSALMGGSDRNRHGHRKYEVNVLVDNRSLEGAPVVMILNPTYNDLFGRMEKEAQLGAFSTDFTMIREGALHRANGGYLVIPVEELFANFMSWDSLKRALKNSEIRIEEMGEKLGFLTTKSLRPTPVPLDVKVLLIGMPQHYQILYALDEDFRELFKVKAEFDLIMDRTDANAREYAASVAMICQREGISVLDPSALSQVIEYSSRLAEDQTKLSTQFGKVADIIREACYYAGQDRAAQITGGHIQKAVRESFYRSNLIQERIREMAERGVLLLDITGAKTGQINGLSVISLGDIAFGRPNKITASIGLGRAGVVDIEREAKLSGPIHTKGVLILTGYLNNRYAYNKPLSLSAQLVFEQSYSEVEGDSASCAELYALLSILAGLPIRQGIAVTGSVNQKGEVQAIGGVNEKIEGYFEICQALGLTGDQGVLIPASNLKNLMLKDEIVKAVEEGRFHIWQVSTIDEGIEFLTGVKAGARADGGFELDSVNYRIEKRLAEMAQQLSRFEPGEPEMAEGREVEE